MRQRLLGKLKLYCSHQPITSLVTNSSTERYHLGITVPSCQHLYVQIHQCARLYTSSLFAGWVLPLVQVRRGPLGDLIPALAVVSWVFQQRCTQGCPEEAWYIHTERQEEIQCIHANQASHIWAQLQ